MLEIELFICIKLDLALNNLQWLICHETRPNKSTSLIYYLQMTEEGKDGFTPFVKTIAWSETQTAASRIRTEVTESITSDNNRYFMPTFLNKEKGIYFTLEICIFLYKLLPCKCNYLIDYQLTSSSAFSRNKRSLWNVTIKFSGNRYKYFGCLNFWDEAGWFLSARVFGLLSSSLLLFALRFGRYVLRPFSGLCRNREPTRNLVLRPLLNQRGSPVLIPLTITGYKC